MQKAAFSGIIDDGSGVRSRIEGIAGITLSKELFKGLQVKVKEPMILWMDNQAAISQFFNEATSIKAKHIDVRLKFVRANMVRKIIAPRYAHTSKTMAKLQTKAFPTPRFLQLRELWQLRDRTVQVEDDTTSSATGKEGVLEELKNVF